MAADLLGYGWAWDVRLDEVATTVHLWQGGQDPKVSVTIARQLPACLPHCQTHFRPGDLMACDQAGDIITALTSAF